MTTHDGEMQRSLIVHVSSIDVERRHVRLGTEGKMLGEEEIR